VEEKTKRSVALTIWNPYGNHGTSFGHPPDILQNFNKNAKMFQNVITKNLVKRIIFEGKPSANICDNIDRLKPYQVQAYASFLFIIPASDIKLHLSTSIRLGVHLVVVILYDDRPLLDRVVLPEFL